MELNLLNRKIKRTKEDGTEIVDLLTASVRFKSTDFFITDGFLIGDDLVMRPDLLSQVVYGNTNNWDALLKFNGISNPFAMDSGDLMLVPELGWMDFQMEDPAKNANNEDVRSQYIDETKENEIDIKKLEYNRLVNELYKVNKNAKFAAFPLPPNLAQPGDKEATLVDGRSVVLGNDVSKG